MKKTLLAVLPALALSFAAPLAHADDSPFPDETLEQLTPAGQGIPLYVAPDAEAPAGVLGNWNANAGHVALQETAQVLTTGQHDVYNIAPGGNVSSGH